METFKCSHCYLTKEVNKSGGTGYGIDTKTDEKICYDCIGKHDLADLTNATPGQKFTFYLSKNSAGQWEVTNWPGTFRQPVTVRKGNHNIARNRYDTSFVVANKRFHGVTFGDWTQIHHVRAVKK